MNDKNFQQKLLKTQVETNDCVIIAIGNYVNDESPDIEIEFALNADTEELFGMFKELFKNISDQQIGGYLSSLEQKGVIWADEREGEMCMAGDSLPNLWWATEDYLEAINPNWNFCLADSQMTMINGNSPSEVYNN